MWNELPGEVVEARMEITFKRHLGKYLNVKDIEGNAINVGKCIDIMVGQRSCFYTVEPYESISITE